MHDQLTRGARSMLIVTVRVREAATTTMRIPMRLIGEKLFMALGAAPLASQLRPGSRSADHHSFASSRATLGCVALLGQSSSHCFCCFASKHLVPQLQLLLLWLLLLLHFPISSVRGCGPAVQR